jgi:hypothetical protein
MASMTITIPDAQALRVLAAVAKKRGVNTAAMNLAQKVAFLKADVRDYWIDTLIEQEVPAVVQTAADTAKATQIADIQTIAVS